jgi:hypothetical protein
MYGEYIKLKDPGSSVNIVSGYGLDDWAVRVQSLAEEKRFFL